MLADKLPSREMILAELEYRATHRIDQLGLGLARLCCHAVAARENEVPHGVEQSQR